MDHSTTHHQVMGSDDQSLESILAGPTKSQQQEAAARKPRPQHEQALKCPRCDSTNTKFCYYNNYSLLQPRYFCKSCRRYWTKGGTLRNVPVGGGCRKSKRPSSSKRIAVAAGHQDHQEHSHPHQLHDLIALNCNAGNPIAALNDFASYEGENFHLPLAFSHKLHKLSSGQFNGHDHLAMGGGHQGFLDTPSMNTLYYGFSDGAVNGELNADGVVGVQLPYEETKPDLHSSESKILWGCPWPINGDGISSSGGWNGIGFGSSWHSLLNSPLS